MYKDLLFVNLQPSVNKKTQNLAILTLKFDDVTVKTIYRLSMALKAVNRKGRIGKRK